MKKIIAVLLALTLFCASAFAIANPWTETDEQGALEKVGVTPLMPEDAQDARWSVMEDGENSIAQLDFTIDGQPYTARAKASGLIDEIEDISGMYFEWEAVEDVNVNGYMPGRLCFAEDGDKFVEVIIWHDPVAGVVFSLSTEQEDVDGLDLEGIAMQVTPNLQGEG